jgi:tetratricopeptide (TPR) repeat protein
MRRKVNVKFLGCLVLAVLLFGGGVHAVHALQIKSNASGLRRQADLAQEQDRPEDTVKYLTRYLGYVPEDLDALATLGLTLDKLAKNIKERHKVFELLDEVLRKEPERRDVRERQVRLALELGRYDPGRNADAAFHLEYLLRQPSAKDSEWEELLGRCYEAKGEYSKAVIWYEKAIKHAPQRLESYRALSQMLRYRLKQEERANKVLDDLVQANGQAPQAYLARAAERRKAGLLTEALEDVTQAFQLAPSDIDVLVASGDFALAAGKLEEARSYLRRGLERHPQTVRAYMLLAEVEVQARRPEEALAAVRQGLQALPERPELVQALATVLIQTGKLTEASEHLARLRKGKTPEVWLDYMDARILLQKGEWPKAHRILERIRPELTKAADLSRQADMLLASCYEERGEPDRQIAAYRRALLVDPLWLPARLGLATTLASTGKSEEALQEYRQVVRQVPGVGFAMARLLSARNLRLPAAQQDWQEINQLLDNAAKSKPDSLELFLTRVDVLLAQKQVPQARRLLEKARDEKPDLVDFWIALAGVWEREKPEKALETFDEAERRLGDRVELRLARLRYWSRHAGPETPAVLAKLGQDLEKFTPADQTRLQRALGDLYFRLGDNKEAKRLWTQVAQQQKKDLRTRLLLFDVALQQGDEAGVKGMLEEIRELEGEEGLLWRYGQVCRLLTSSKDGNKQRLAEARTLLAKVAAQRPSWAPVALREANINELEGNPDRALESYLRAIDLGDQSPQVIRRSLQLLFERHRFDDIQQLVHKLPPQSMAAPDVQRYLSRVALEGRDNNQALESAKAAAAGSKDYHDHLWLGQILLMVGKPAEAEAPLRQAVQLAEKVPEPWIALVQYLVRSRKYDQAKTALEEAQQKLPPDQAPLGLAQCFEAIGNLKRAEEQYQKALATKPEDVGLLRILASFYQRHNQYNAAEPYLRKLLDPKTKATAAELAWARRALAGTLVASGGYQQYRDALALLDENAKAGANGVEDQRARAVVLATQPSSRKEAIRLLEDLFGRRLSNLEDQFLLAQLYETDRNWVKARERLVGVVTSPQGETVPHLVYYINCLLRHDQAEEATVWLNKLEKLDFGSPRTAELKVRTLKALGRVDEAVTFVKTYAQIQGVPVELVAALYETLGQGTPAEEMYRRYAAQSPQPESQLVLAEFLGRQNRVGEALAVCEKAMPKCSPEAVAIASVDVVRSGSASAEQSQRVEGWLKAILAKNPKALAVMVIFGDLRYLTGQYAEAESLYRQVLSQEPNHVSGLNNLAWLLALHSGKGDEALDLIKRAMERSGPLPALLDTRGVVYLTLGLGELAKNDLEDAILGQATATRYFHLVQAQQKTRDRLGAAATWRKARAMGLKKETLSGLEQTTFQSLIEEFEPKK